MSTMAQGEGMPPICGRIVALLVYDGGPISFTDLAARLDVSRASISTSARVLEERGLLRRMKQAGKRGVFFDLADDPYATLLNGLMERARTAHGIIQTTLEALPDDDASRRSRMADLSEFYNAITVASASALAQITGDQT